ncbi:MAG TPA: hypothetical protein PKC43_11245 [Phycisphaerales bacterium]|nr:hypothetical protein [Phycisphaerales bacterium]HMP38008.1 hypothetical protein [Phycisphaerales bacterium]
MARRGPVRPPEIRREPFADSASVAGSSSNGAAGAASTVGAGAIPPGLPATETVAALRNDARRAWVLFGAALVVVAAALLASIATWLIQSSRAGMAIAERARVEAELRTALERHGAMAKSSDEAVVGSEEAQRRAEAAAAEAARARAERDRRIADLEALDAERRTLIAGILDPRALPAARLRELIGSDPALRLRVFVEAPPQSGVTVDALESAIRGMVPSKRFTISADARHYLVLSVIVEPIGAQTSIAVMLCVEGPWWTATDASLDARQAWVRLWCRHALSANAIGGVDGTIRRMSNDLLDRLSAEFAPAATEPGSSEAPPGEDDANDPDDAGAPATDARDGTTP